MAASTKASSARLNGGRRGIRDVALRAGVSVGTVSNVLNKPALVAAETRVRVENAIRELDFVRNGPARQLRAGTSRAVGAIVLDISNPFFTDVARGIEDRLAEDGCILILGSSDEQSDKEQRYLRLLEEQGVRGVLIAPAGGDVGWLEEARKHSTAIVLLDRTSPHPDLCSVAVDDVRGGQLAARHLIEAGHDRIAFVNGPASIRQCADRRKGIGKALRSARLPVSRSLVEVNVDALNATAGEQALPEVLAQDPPVTAIVCANDLLALGVLRGLMARDIAVPEQIAVVGYDDVEFAAVLSTPLTSVRQPRYEIGRTAAELLLEETARSRVHRHQQVQFQPELIVRASSSPG